MKERRLHGKRYWELGIRLQNKDVWRLTKKKRQKLKGVSIRENGRRTN